MGIIIFLIGIGIAGGICIVGGAVNACKFWQTLLCTTGGVLLGTCTAGILSGISQMIFEKKFLSILKKTTASKFNTPEDFLKPYRERFYHYNLSEMGEELFWRLTIYDFRKHGALGELNCIAHWSDKGDNRKKYTVNGGLRDNRLVFFIKEKEGTEDTAVEIFPFASETHHIYHAGIWVLVTWDDNHALLPTILSKEALHGCDKVGNIPKEKSDDFYKTWQYGIRKLKPILPNCNWNEML